MNSSATASSSAVVTPGRTRSPSRASVSRRCAWHVPSARSLAATCGRSRNTPPQPLQRPVAPLPHTSSIVPIAVRRSTSLPPAVPCSETGPSRVVDVEARAISRACRRVGPRLAARVASARRTSRRGPAVEDGDNGRPSRRGARPAPRPAPGCGEIHRGSNPGSASGHSARRSRIRPIVSSSGTRSPAARIGSTFAPSASRSRSRRGTCRRSRRGDAVLGGDPLRSAYRRRIPAGRESGGSVARRLLQSRKPS